MPRWSAHISLLFAERGLLDIRTDAHEAASVTELLDRLERQADEISDLRVRLAIARRQLVAERARRERIERKEFLLSLEGAIAAERP